MRAFTAKDRKEIKLVAQNYPSTEFYDTETLLTELGIGEALITVLDEKGSPTPLAHTMLCAPRTRMDVLSSSEQDEIISTSQIANQYNEVINRQSAYEMLSQKIESAVEQEDQPKESNSQKEEGNTLVDRITAVSKNPVVKQVARELTRGIFGMLFGKPATRRRRY
jgi:hypothetical protein